MNLKLFALLFLALPFLKGQQVAPTVRVGNTNFYGCLDSDFQIVQAGLKAVSPFDSTVFQKMPVVPLSHITCGFGWTGFNGAITVRPFSSLSMEEGVYRSYMYHEYSHARTDTVFFWPAMEGLAELGKIQLLALTSTPRSDGWMPEKMARHALRKMGTYSQARRFLEFTRDTDYELAMAPFLWVAAANDFGPASEWAKSPLVGHAYAAVREETIRRRQVIRLEPEGLAETLEAMGNIFPMPIDGQPFVQWMSKFYRNSSSTDPFFEVTTSQNGFPTAVNPNQVVVQSFRDLPAPQGGWPDIQWSFASSYPERTVVNLTNGNRLWFTIEDWSGNRVWQAVFGAKWYVQLPILGQGAYTVSLFDGGSIIHQNDFVISSINGGTVVIKKARSGEVKEFSLNEYNINGRILYSSQGFAVVDPDCKQYRPCSLTLAAGNWRQSFTVVTPFQDDQVIRFLEPPQPARSRAR